MRHVLSVLVVSAALYVAPASFASATPSFTDTAADLAEAFSVSSNTQIPGKILKPGSYTIKILDHLSDRMVLRVEDSHGKSEGIFLGVPSTDLAGKGTGPVSWQNGPHKNDALRGFVFPGGAVEFVYAKEEAVPIAKANAAKVLAIDPASEGRPSAGNLSDEDRQMVTLWTLAATRVGPEGGSQPAIKADRYNAPIAEAQTRQPAPAPASTAQTTTAPAPATVASRPAPPLQQVARAKRPAPLTALPHTAGDLPLAAAFAFLLLAAAGTLRVVTWQRS